MSTRNNPQRSPRPSERDVHIQVVWTNEVHHYRACETAARNFSSNWRRSHNAAVEARVVNDDSTGSLRLPCEALWLTP